MSTLRVLTEVAIATAAIGQGVLLWLQLRSLANYTHRSFAILALGTGLGLVYSAILLFIYFGSPQAQSVRDLYLVALIVGTSQIPVAIWGTAWLFRSYGQLYRK